ncbi:MAG: hypothetical protein SFV81_22140 [Pirellulaceae bacterium]|nr:hypothetical protein [Pirellulaceae bacterium]
MGSVTHGQNANSTAPSPAPNGAVPNETSGNPNTNSPASTAPSKPWLVRDPATGRVFQQQLVPVSVPVTRWEARTVEQTVYEPRVTTQVQQVPQTTYVPNTQYVMQPKVTGWWNPFKQPVQAYQYVPVTNWTPQTQQVSNPVLTQQWVPRQQKVVVYQPVQATEIRQQLVQTELPQSQSVAPATVYAATPRQPLFRLPILAQQRVLPWAPATNGYGVSYTAPANTYAATTAPAQSGWRAVEQAPSQSSLANAGPAAPQSRLPNASQNASQSALQSSPYMPPAYTPPVTPPQYATSGLRPIAPVRSPLVLPPLSLPRLASSPYSAPLQTTTSVGNTASRDVLQAGMQPTVLR